MSLPLAAWAARCNAASTPSVTKVKCGLSSHGNGRSGVVCQHEHRSVEGGFSPHQPFHSSSGQLPRTEPNMLRPMIHAPQCRIPARQNRRPSLLSRRLSHACVELSAWATSNRAMPCRQCRAGFLGFDLDQPRTHRWNSKRTNCDLTHESHRNLREFTVCKKADTDRMSRI